MSITLGGFFSRYPNAVLTFLDNKEYKVSLIDGEITLSSNSNSLGGFFINIEDKKGFFRPGAIGKWTRFSDESISLLEKAENELDQSAELQMLVKAVTIIRKTTLNEGKVGYWPVNIFCLIDPILKTPETGSVVLGNGDHGYTVVTNANGIKYIDLVKFDHWRMRLMSNEELVKHKLPELDILLNG